MNDSNELPRWMQRDNDWDGAYQNRHLNLEEATEVNAERRRSQQESRRLRPHRVSGLHAESAVFIPLESRGAGVEPPEDQEHELAQEPHRVPSLTTTTLPQEPHMPAVDPTYEALRVAVDPTDATWSGRELTLLGRGIQAWDWLDEARRRRLPPLLAFSPGPADAQVLVRWRDHIDDKHMDVEDATGGLVSRKVPVFGTLSTPIDGVGHVLLTLNRELFSGIGGGNNGVVIQHELGHCLGLRHSHGGIMRRSITIEPTIITQKNREDAAALRLAGVVGVDSLVGN